MEEKWQYRGKFILVFSILIGVIFFVSMPLMIRYAMHKNVVIAENTEILENKEEEIKPPASKSWKLTFGTDSTEEITIVCPEKVSESNFDVSLRYDINRVNLFIRGFDPLFFDEKSPAGNCEYVKAGTGEYNGDYVLFSFELTQLCECFYEAEDNRISLAFKPYEHGDKPIFLVDPGHGGASVGTKAGDLCEKDITLKIAKAVEKMASEKNYRVMLTRNADETISVAGRINVGKLLQADFYLGLQLDLDIDAPEKYGMRTAFNPVYFNREISNVDFSDLILKNVCTETSNRALGLYENSEGEEILETFKVPAAILYAGFMSNTEELKLLSEDEYIKMIAKGIISGFDAVYAKYNLSKK